MTAPKAHAPLVNDPHRESLLIVDDEARIRRGLATNLRLRGFHCRTAADAEDALAQLAAEPAAIVVSDIRMPGHDGLWLLERVRSFHPDTEVILLTGFAEVEPATRALRLGASDFLTKPVAMIDLLTAIERASERRRLVLENRAYQVHLEERVAEATRELRASLATVARSYRAALEALCSALDARERETAEHSLRVTRYTLELADQLGIDPSVREDVGRGALLHDIGKIGIPDAVLLKTGPLSEEEWRIMRRHPVIGHDILEGIDFLAPASQIVLCHHERWDGTGYPLGLAGEAIPLGARIFAVADALDAITSERLYRPAASFDQAFAEIERCSGSQFDPRVVEALLAMGHPERGGTDPSAAGSGAR